MRGQTKSSLYYSGACQPAFNETSTFVGRKQCKLANKFEGGAFGGKRVVFRFVSALIAVFHCEKMAKHHRHLKQRGHEFRLWIVRKANKSALEIKFDKDTISCSPSRAFQK